MLRDFGVALQQQGVLVKTKKDGNGMSSSSLEKSSWTQKQVVKLRRQEELGVAGTRQPRS